MAAMKGLTFDQMMMLGGLGVAAIVAYEVYLNLPNIQASIQGALTPQANMYTEQGYYCQAGGTPGPTGLCPNGQMAISPANANTYQQAGYYCPSGGTPSTTGMCPNGQMAVPAGSTAGYGQTGTYCQDGSTPNPTTGLCLNGQAPIAGGAVSPTIAGGLGVPGSTTFTDPTTGQVYDPTTGALLTPGGSYTTPSLANPYASVFPTLAPLGQGLQYSCGDGSNPQTTGTGMCANGSQPSIVQQQQQQAPQPTTITTANPAMYCSDGSTTTTGACANGSAPQSTPYAVTTPATPTTTTPTAGTMACADGSTVSATTGLCGNGQPPVTSLPAGTATSPSGTVPVTTTSTTTPTAITPATSGATTISTTTTTTPTSTAGHNMTNTNQWGGRRGRFGYVGYQSEGAMISAQARNITPRNPNRATVTSYSSVRPAAGNSPITTEVFGRRYFPRQPIYVSGIR